MSFQVEIGEYELVGLRMDGERMVKYDKGFYGGDIEGVRMSERRESRVGIKF